MPETLVDGRPAPRKPSICVAIIHHVRQCTEKKLKIDWLLEALSMQTDLPESILILDTRPYLPQPHLDRYHTLAGRVRITARPMRTIQEGFNFYAHARNELLKECREEVIIWLDADERPDPDVVERVREGFSDPSTVAAILCLRPIPTYWRVADELQYVAKEGHTRARLRVFRTELLRSLGGFEPGRPEWGRLAAKIYPLAREGRLRVSHERLYAWHDSPASILHSLRSLSLQRRPRRSMLKARALLGVFAVSVAIPITLGHPILALSILLLVPGLFYVLYLARSLRALPSYGTARAMHTPAAALLYLVDTVNHLLSAAF